MPQDRTIPDLSKSSFKGCTGMFNRSLWRAQVGQRLDIFARNPQQDMHLSGSPSLLAHIAACTLRPFLEAFATEPIAAVQTMASFTSGPGANMIVKRAPHLRYQAARLLDQGLRANAELRMDVEQILVDIDTIHLVRQRLHGSQEEWFSNVLSGELKSFASTEFAQLRRRLRDRWKSFYDIFRELRQRRGSYTQEDLILLYVGLNDSASSVRAEAARRLGEYAWVPPEKLISKLIQVALYDRDLETRNAAARALGGLRDRIISPYLLNKIGQHLSSEDRFVRSASALLLAEFGELAGTEQLIGQLTRLLRDDDHYTREAAACALGRMGEAAVRLNVMDALAHALEDINEDVHGAALASLTRLREMRASHQPRSKDAPETRPVVPEAQPLPEPSAPGGNAPSIAGHNAAQNGADISEKQHSTEYLELGR
jgi:hypothetical protein